MHIGGTSTGGSSWHSCNTDFQLKCWIIWEGHDLGLRIGIDFGKVTVVFRDGFTERTGALKFRRPILSDFTLMVWWKRHLSALLIQKLKQVLGVLARAWQFFLGSSLYVSRLIWNFLKRTRACEIVCVCVCGWKHFESSVVIQCYRNTFWFWILIDWHIVTEEYRKIILLLVFFLCILYQCSAHAETEDFIVSLSLTLSGHAWPSPIMWLRYPVCIYLAGLALREFSFDSISIISARGRKLFQDGVSQLSTPVICFVWVTFE